MNTFLFEIEGHALFVCSVGSSALTEECSVPDAMVGLSEYISICVFNQRCYFNTPHV